MSFNVIGVGPGDSELLTVKAVRLIKEADKIIVPVKKEGSKISTALSIAQPYIEDLTKVDYFYFPMTDNFSSDIETQLLFKHHGERLNQCIKEGNKVVFLTLGDPSIYSTFAYIEKYIDEVTYVPGIPSFINGAALAKQYLCIGDESLCILNMTDREEDLQKKFDLHERIVVMKVCANQNLLKKLIKQGRRTAIFMSNIGLKDERISTDVAVLDEKLPYFTIAIINGLGE
jgi:precorrin-2/cobalt-factor-2 C20-methyltransferase